MTADRLMARANRREQLFRGVCKEAALWKKDDRFFEFRGRKVNRNATQDVVAASEAARLMLPRTKERLDEQALRLRWVEQGRG